MNALPVWAEALDISADVVAQWAAAARPGQPALAYALERGLIDAGVYLGWAREAYGLPSLESGFFFDGIDVELVRGARESESYAAWLYPVGRWDDVTYVACVEPIEGLPETFCLVLADARAMFDAWNAAGDMPIDPYVTPPVPEEVPAEIPAGFHADAKIVSLDIDLMVEGFAKGYEHGHRPEPAPPAALSPEPVVQAAPVAPAVPAPVPLGVKAERTPASPASSVPGGAARASFEEAALAGVFGQLNQNFQNASVFRFNETMVQLYKASAGMKVVGAGPKLDLSYPSFLRIVARTKHPYHGHLVDSPIHRDFFRDLGAADLPECTSAVPLVIDGALWGVLIVSGSAERRDAAALEPVRAAAEQLTQALGEAWRRAAA